MFEIDEPLDRISSRMSCKPRLMLNQAAPQVRGHTDVNESALSVRQDVDARAHTGVMDGLEAFFDVR